MIYAYRPTRRLFVDAHIVDVHRRLIEPARHCCARVVLSLAREVEQDIERFVERRGRRARTRRIPSVIGELVDRHSVDVPGYIFGAPIDGVGMPLVDIR